jgi:hypothetical protein
MLYLLPLILMLITFFYTFRGDKKEELENMAANREKMLQEKEIISKLNRDI